MTHASDCLIAYTRASARSCRNAKRFGDQGTLSHKRCDSYPVDWDNATISCIFSQADERSVDELMTFIGGADVAEAGKTAKGKKKRGGKKVKPKSAGDDLMSSPLEDDENDRCA